MWSDGDEVAGGQCLAANAGLGLHCGPDFAFGRVHNGPLHHWFD